MTRSRLFQHMKRQYQHPFRHTSVERYLASGQVPWTEGYDEYRADFINRVIRDAGLMSVFRSDQDLPDGYGFRLDERVIEYPWVLSRLSLNSGHLLDAGASLNHEYLLQLSLLMRKSIAIYTLVPEGPKAHRPNVSYICGDLRNTILRDGLFQEIVCISTLEHIGMDNAVLYTHDCSHQESRPSDYRLALAELSRLLAPNGRLFITVPYGQYENHGWFQQFDRARLTDVIVASTGTVTDLAFFKYEATGWMRSDADACKECEYYDIHHARAYAPDYAAAARAVACIELTQR